MLVVDFQPRRQKYLPDGNIARFGRALFRFPGMPNRGNDGQFFVFGTSRGVPTDYPARNAMQRAMQQAFREEGELRTGAMLLPADEVGRLPGAEEEWR